MAYVFFLIRTTMEFEKLDHLYSFKNSFVSDDGWTVRDDDCRLITFAKFHANKLNKNTC